MSKPTVAIIGASADRKKFGNISVRAHQQCGYQVFPVHPSASEIEGLPAFPHLAAIGQPIDRISLYVPPAVGIKLLEEIRSASPKSVWLNPGTESFELIERARELGLPIVLGCSIIDLGVSPADFP